MFYAILIVIIKWKNIIYIIKYENHQKKHNYTKTQIEKVPNLISLVL